MSEYHLICHNDMATCMVNPGQECIHYCYANFVNGIFKASDNIVPCFINSDGNGDAKCNEVQGYNSIVKLAHAKTRECFLKWRRAGSVQFSSIFDDVCFKTMFLKSIEVKLDKDALLADKMANRFCKKRTVDFWKEVCKVKHGKSCRSYNQIDGVEGARNIATLRKNKYCNLYNRTNLKSLLEGEDGDDWWFQLLCYRNV